MSNTSSPVKQSSGHGFATTPPPGSPSALADRDSYFSAMLERNCSVGKGRRSTVDNINGFVTELDERVERCGGGKEPFLIGVAGGRGLYQT